MLPPHAPQGLAGQRQPMVMYQQIGNKPAPTPAPSTGIFNNTCLVVLAVLGVVGIFLYRKSVFLPDAEGPAQGAPAPAFLKDPPTTPAPDDPCRTGPCKRSFYMYRAQSDVDYAMENVNTANLAGVLWYLHNEVVKSTPRKFDVTRVLRLRVTMMTTQAWWNSHFSQFAPFMAFDGARCTVPNSDSFWDTYGFIIGCQGSQLDVANYRSYYQSVKYCEPGKCNAPVWYSLPGECPAQDYLGKDEFCKARYPGGLCYSAYNQTTHEGDPHDWNVTGAWNCTYYVQWAGEVRLDELVGIENYTIFRYSGMKEYDEWTDRGEGVDFWDGIHNETACHDRMEKMRWLIHQSAQHLDPAEFPFDLPEPICDSP